MELDDWITKVVDALQVAPDSVDQQMVLDLARDVARAVDRPAAPLTAYLAGLAVGRGLTPAQARDRIVALLDNPPD